MAKAPRRLKVFQAQFGFYDTVVAAPSQVAALQVWGTHQNLFANGDARVTDDPEAIKAAKAHPETVLRRAAGSNQPFALKPASLPDVPDAPKRSPSKRPKPAAPRKPERPPADRSALDKAEVALRKVDDDRKAEEAELDHRQAALDEARSAAQSRYVSDRKRASQAIDLARKAYRKAGGRD